MLKDGKIWIGRGGEDCYLLPSMANRHGLITGATGTGKTISLKVLAESFSAMGVPVFLADVKGDLAGMCRAGEVTSALEKRLEFFDLADFPYQEFPTCFWDLYGQKGHPIRTTVSDFGPILLSRLMELTDVQQSVLEMLFRIADDKGLLLLDMKDLRSMIRYASEHRAEYLAEYGNMTPQSLGALQRKVLVLEDNGGGLFFGEPALDIRDWMKYDLAGRGYINVLDCTELFLHPTMYATFMIWLLNALYETMPEIGDPEKPRLVFFFDEAHLLFETMPRAIITKLEQVIRLIRSKGIGVYFITQTPADIPDNILAQLSNKIQHALHAYTPKDQKAVRTAAESFRPNPAFDTATAISELRTGEALISMLDEDGRPSVVEKAMILPPQSLIGTVSEDIRQSVMAVSEMGAKYDAVIDRYSAYENLADQDQLALERQKLQEERKALEAEQARLDKEAEKARIAEERRQAAELAAAERERQKELRRLAEEKRKAEERRQRELSNMVSSAARGFSNSFGRQLGNRIFRGLLGGSK